MSGQIHAPGLIHIYADFNGVVYYSHEDRMEVWTPLEPAHNEQGERVYTTPIAELSVFNVSPQRVPHELPRRDAGS
jgi:hypothetical protein